MSSALDYELTASELRRDARDPAQVVVPQGIAISSAPAGDTVFQGIDLTGLIRQATLAASSHNSQPWLFRPDPSNGTITILPDFTRRLPVSDPNDSHLFRSLGCAAENLVHAASAQGRLATVRYDGTQRAVIVELRKPADGHQLQPSDLASAIAVRQCTRCEYAGLPVSLDHLRLLQRSGAGSGVRIELLSTESEKANLIEYVAQGNHVQLHDREYRQELISWLRFNDDEALRSRDGLASRVTGNPNLPRWMAANLLLPFLLTAHGQSDIDARNIHSSAGIAVFLATNGNDEASWVQSGRAFERFALRAAQLDIRVAPMNQPVEVSSVRTQFQSWLGLHGNETVQMVVRFGYGPLAPYSLRRPVESVILK
jgi:hypothetical protein